jgi:very-short-patch-repair endonuclease
MDAERSQADMRRMNALARNGWRILRYTWHDLANRPRAVLAEIAHEVARGLGAAR